MSGLFGILGRLADARLLTPGAVLDLAATALGSGVNLGALPAFAARRFRDRTALVDDGTPITFTDLNRQVEALACVLRSAHGIGKGDVVGVLGRNGAGLVRGAFGASRLACRVLLLNPEMSRPQMEALIQRHAPKLVIAETDSQALVAGCCPVVLESELMAAAPADPPHVPGDSGGTLVVLTGGTTGAPKAAARAPRMGNFGLLFIHLVTALGLDRHPACYVAVPMFHGYGFAAFLVALTLGRTVYLERRFEAAEACAVIARDRLKVVAVVPSMLQRMLAEPGADLSSLRCVISGGAALPAPLAVATRERLGDVLFNLYGTSEAGVAIFATPQDLAAAPDTIGRPIWGVRVTIRDTDGVEVPEGKLGRLCVQSAAAVAAHPIETGDMGFRDAGGRIFVRGRNDDMIVSGGENVHPWEVESVLLTHPCIAEAAVVGVPDEAFGQRLAAFVTAKAGETLTPEALEPWLEERVARFQRPRSLEVRSELPLTAVGKVNRRQLQADASA